MLGRPWSSIIAHQRTISVIPAASARLLTSRRLSGALQSDVHDIEAFHTITNTFLSLNPRIQTMKLSNAFSPLIDLSIAIQLAFLPTLAAIFKDLTLLLHPHALSRIVMHNIWVLFGEGADTNARDVKTKLITPNAYGVVLDVGAGTWFHTHSNNFCVYGSA